MTPQVARHRTSAFPSLDSGPLTAGRRRSHGRYSMGGFTPGGLQTVYDGNTSFLVPSGRAEGEPKGPRRVKLVEAWKVEDLIIPLKEENEDDQEESEKEEDEEIPLTGGEMHEHETEDQEEDMDSVLMPPPPPPLTPGRAKREKLSDEERRVSIICVIDLRHR